jgi:fumarate hydratase subunit beta
MAEYKLKTPLTEADMRKLKLGDVVYLSGMIYTARDEAHMHILHALTKGEKLPVDFRGTAVFHCGPIMKKDGSEWKLVAAGPTTSSRMNTLEPPFMEKTGVRAIIGKGGMNQGVIDSMQKLGIVYLAITGGAAVLASKGIRKVHGVHWYEELGMPEALWILEGDNFGPLTVAIDTNGNSLYQAVDAQVKKNTEGVKKKLGIA